MKCIPSVMLAIIPASLSHGGAYYKISYGTGGIERSDLNGERNQE